MSDQPGLQSRVQEVEQAVERLNSAISRSSTAKIVAVLIILLTIFGVAYKYYDATKAIQKPEAFVAAIQGELPQLMKAYEPDMKDILAGVKEPVMKAIDERISTYQTDLQALADELREPITNAVQAKIDKEAGNLSATFRAQGEQLVERLKAHIQQRAEAVTKDIVDKHGKDITDMVDNPQQKEKLVEHFHEAMTNVGEQLISKHHRDAINKMRDTWEKFPVADIKPEEKDQVMRMIIDEFVQLFVDKFTTPMYQAAAKGQTESKGPSEAPAPAPKPAAEPAPSTQ